MGCTSSKKETKSATRKYTESTSAGNIPIGNDEQDKWRVEPQKALNHFLKGKSGEQYFDMDSSLFDYFQDDEFVELRTLLDEPLGRSHFLAHVEHYLPERANLVRLWLLLHKFHHMQSDDESRYQAAKCIYKNYFQISKEAKIEAEKYREKNSASVADQLSSISSDQASVSSTTSQPTMLKYHSMLVPEVCQAFPPRIVAVIILLRPNVEKALYGFLSSEIIS